MLPARKFTNTARSKLPQRTAPAQQHATVAPRPSRHSYQHCENVQARKGLEFQLPVAQVDELSTPGPRSPTPGRTSYQLLEVRGLDTKTVLTRSGTEQDYGIKLGQGSPAPHAFTSPTRLLAYGKSLFLPDGYPHTTTPDYLPYQLWATPTHVLGSVAHALTTSSLLQAVGVSAGPVTATAASAAIKWITKNGIGALGRFVVGGSLAQEFDRDPRRWRMIAEFCTATGAGLEIATAAFPQHFLLLASTGHFAKALGKAIGKPVFRVIQTHFARDNNVGAVAAKEEVWEVVAQLSGYALSVAVLSAVDELIKTQGGVSTGTELVAIWAAVQGTHACLRYKSLRTLQFNHLNEKRTRLLVADHVAGKRLQNVADCNAVEPIMLPASVCMQPRVRIGEGSMADLLAVAAAVLGTEQQLVNQQANDQSRVQPGAAVQEPHSDGVHVLGVRNGLGHTMSSELVSSGALYHAADALLECYAQEDYVLVWEGGAAGAQVIIRDDAPSTVLARVLWQAYWLQRHVPAGQPACLRQLHMSVQALQAEYPVFEEEATKQGWDVSSVLMSMGAVRFRTE